MGWAACARIVTTAIVPSVGYGVSVTGITDGALVAWRALVASAYGPTRGRSTTARLAMEGVDLAQQAVVGPIWDWVEAWWDEIVAHKNCKKLGYSQSKLLAKARGPTRSYKEERVLS